MMEREKREKQGRLLAGCLYLLYGAACCFLYYHMCLPEKGKYHSDLPAHIQSGMNGEAYSLLEILYKYICRAGFGSKVIPVLLTVLTLAAVYLSFRIMQQIVPDGNALALQLLAFAANLEMPLYLPLIHKYRNMGLQSGSMWHNDTYLACGYLDCWCCFCISATRKAIKKPSKAGSGLHLQQPFSWPIL